MSLRVASCSCGQLTAQASAEPVRVSVCHCLACQRRTGSLSGAQARLVEGRVAVNGRASEFLRVGDEASHARFGFCPDYGATVYCRVAELTGVVIIPTGAFTDRGVPAPAISVYAEQRRSWVGAPLALEAHGLRNYSLPELR